MASKTPATPGEPSGSAGAIYVDRVVICDAYAPPDKHYRLLGGGKSKLTEGRRPSMRVRASAREAKGGITSVLAKREANLFEDAQGQVEEQNEFVNDLREKVQAWREEGYPGTALVTRRLLEWWFEREEERAKTFQRFFFCQREAIETVIYLYEVCGRRKMPETGDLVRYALKLATGTGKTIVMALLVTWSTLHRMKVSNSSLTNTFLVLVPNLTVKDRVSGVPRGDGLDPSGVENLYAAFDMVPPEFRDGFRPKVIVRNWQGIALESKRDDWIDEDVGGDGRFIPASVLWALRRRGQKDPNTPIRRLLENARDVMIINDEGHHAYGEKRTARGEEPQFIKWSKIIARIGQVARIPLVVDVSATPWYGSGSPKPEGTLYEWLVSDFSVYDAFESGLVKVVRLPDPTAEGKVYIDLWDGVKGAKTREEYLSACKGAIASIYASWKSAFQEWTATLANVRGPCPVLLVVADNATRAGWLFEHLTRDFELLRNPDDEDRTRWITIQVDSKVFDADKGNEAVLREMVSTVGKPGKPGENVRCIVSVNMLSEGWDVKSVTHILGLRAFGSPLLTEQIIGRGLRRVDYSVLNQPLDERGDGADETVDAFGIPFVGFPVQKKTRPKTGAWGARPTPIEKDDAKAKYRMRLPNLRSWAIGVTRPLAELINVEQLPSLKIDPKLTPPNVIVKPVVGSQPEEILTLETFRQEYPLLRSKMILARDLFETLGGGRGDGLGEGPTFEELLDLTDAYVERRVEALGKSEKRDIGIYTWAQKARDNLENAIRNAPVGTAAMPIPGSPEFLDTEELRRFQWTGILAPGKKCHLSKVPCHTDLEREFAEFLDRAPDVLKYVKNERFGFSITYYENNRPRQYFPDFIVQVRESSGREVTWVAETKGEIRHNTELKRQAADLWCKKMSETSSGTWRHVFVQQKRWEKAAAGGAKTFAELIDALVVAKAAPEPQLKLFPLDDGRVKLQAFKTLLPLYSLKAAAGYFGRGEAVEPLGWVEAEGVGKLDQNMFVAQAIGRSMEPRIYSGDYCVFRAKPAGSRQGKIVLVEYRGGADPETGGSYAVKRYSSEKATEDGAASRRKVTLSPLHPDFSPITLYASSDADVRIVAEFVAVLGR